jgi:hypothetical protein
MENKDEILNFWPMRTFIQAIQDQTVRADISRPVNIDPIIAHIRSIEPNSFLLLHELTAKVCWPLGHSAKKRRRSSSGNGELKKSS